MKLELFTNATVVDDAIKFVRHQKPLLSKDIDGNGSKENKEDREESPVPSYWAREEEKLEEKREVKPKEESIRAVNKIF
jgi:hypothetical protein